MAIQSRAADVIDNVVTAMRSVTGYRSPADTGTGFVVFDGPELYVTEIPGNLGYVVIGYADDPDEPSPSTESVITAGPMVPNVHPRDEVLTIGCIASWSSGDAEFGSPSTARRAAMGIMGDVANYVRVNPSLGLDTSGVVGGVRLRSFVTAGAMTQYVGGVSGGFTCDWVFTITTNARI